MVQTAQQFLTQYQDRNPDSGLAWLSALRETAAESLRETGLPTLEWEEWKYTGLRALETLDMRESSGAKADESLRLLEPSMPALRLTFVNGRCENLPQELPKGVTVSTLLAMLEKDPQWVERYLVNLGRLGDYPFLALNTACMTDGLVIHLARNTRLDMPIEVLFWAEGGGVKHQRHLVVMDEGAEATLLEIHGGKEAGFSNHVMDITMEKSAILRHYRVQEEDRRAVHITTSFLTMFGKSSYEAFTLTTGAGLSRHEVTTSLLDSGISCIFNGAYMINGGQHADTTIKMGHLGPACASSQKYRGVIDDQARAVFQGKIQVSRPAQKTDGCQSHHALLLSEEAQVSAKPELDIQADDVTCRHGAAAGQADKDALFYMKARGIPHAQAMALLVRSFIGAAIEGVTLPCMREALGRKIDKWLDER